MSSMPVSREAKRPHINRRIVGFEFMVKEVVSEDLGILPGSQGGSKGESIAGSVGEAGSENGDDEEDVNISDAQVCQPCDEDAGDVAEGKTNNSEVGVVEVNKQVAARLYEYDEEEIKERPYRCNQRGCNYRTKQRSSIKLHLANIHDIGVTWHTCPQEGCEYKAKERGMIKKHLANVHDIGVTWHTCSQEGCKYKAKQRGMIKRHLAHMHDIGVTWHTCPQEGCQYKAKHRSNIKRHISRHHV